ncbi:hypothetical protein PVAP13_7KG189600 [Panicum virgatum]|uniref:Uncharacterized protein n=1 Tax=Panicum virgatum TaxID=38727 RepID=A0A8T0QHD8_PANVG|nr:hypothetical protein PVAP13_7KG189600 [Panicum virgatum]
MYIPAGYTGTPGSVDRNLLVRKFDLFRSSDGIKNWSTRGVFLRRRFQVVDAVAPHCRTSARTCMSPDTSAQYIYADNADQRIRKSSMQVFIKANGST